jgi:hypothetical protein
VVTAATHWDKWVAIGTLALAGTTFLAVLVGIRTTRLTRRLADAAQTTAKADTRALENSVRPLLLRVPPGLYTAPATYSFRNIGYGRREQILPDAIQTIKLEPDAWLVSVPVRNKGIGPAVIWVPHPYIRIPPNSAATQRQATVRVVPLGELTRLNFAVMEERLGVSWYVAVAYTDSSGAQLQRTELAIKGSEPGTGYESLASRSTAAPTTI